MQWDAHRLCTAVLGERHPDTLDEPINNWRQTYANAAADAEALVLERGRELPSTSYRSVSANGHPDTLGSLNNLAVTTYTISGARQKRPLVRSPGPGRRDATCQPATSPPRTVRRCLPNGSSFKQDLCTPASLAEPERRCISSALQNFPKHAPSRSNRRCDAPMNPVCFRPRSKRRTLQIFERRLSAAQRQACRCLQPARRKS